MDDKTLIDSIVNKIINGERSWLPEELQFQKNYPDRIELALKMKQLNLPIWKIMDDYLIVPVCWTLDKLSKAKNLLGVKRFISAPESAAVALFMDSNIQGKICVIIDDGRFWEIGVFEIDGGVIETMFTMQLKFGMYKVSSICNMIQHNIGMIYIDKVIYISNHHVLLNETDLGCFLGRPPALKLSNIETICGRGVFIYNKLRGVISLDILLLSTLTQTIYIQTPDSIITPLIMANTTIPTRNSDMFEINGEYVEFDIIIRQGNNHNPTDNPIISVLHWNNLSPVEGIRL